MPVTPASPGCLAGPRPGPDTVRRRARHAPRHWLCDGADIAKVERPRGESRPHRLCWLLAGFMMYNANKRSLTVNLKSERGLALVKEMVKKADVMAENFAPGAVERLGLGYDVVSAINPGIIYAQIKGFGAGSPFENGLAFDPIAQAAGGADEHHRRARRAADQLGPTIGDTGTGCRMAFSIVSALSDRTCTRATKAAGRDAGSDHASPRAAAALSPRPAPASGAAASGGPQPAEASIFLPAGRSERRDLPLDQPRPTRKEHRPRLLKLIGREDLIGDARFDTYEGRVEHEAEVNEIIGAWTRQRTKHEAMTQLSGAGVAPLLCSTSNELVNEPSFYERGILQHMTHGERKMALPTWPVRFDGVPAKVEAAPLLGEHTARGAVRAGSASTRRASTALRSDGIAQRYVALPRSLALVLKVFQGVSWCVPDRAADGVDPQDAQPKRSIAIVGATPRMQYGGRFLAAALKAKDRVRVYAVNPRYDDIMGEKSYPSVTDLPEAPDVVAVVVPYDQVLDVLEESHRKGAGSAIVISAGFAERGTGDRRDLQGELGEFARASGMRVSGPNCLGLANVKDDIWATASSRGASEGLDRRTDRRWCARAARRRSDRSWCGRSRTASASATSSRPGTRPTSTLPISPATCSTTRIRGSSPALSKASSGPTSFSKWRSSRPSAASRSS